MKLIRMEKDKNNFALVGMTLGKLMAIQRGLGIVSENCLVQQLPNPVGDEVLGEMEGMKLDGIDCFGVTHVGENGVVKKMIKVYK